MQVKIWAATLAVVSGLAGHFGMPQPHPVVGVQASPVASAVDTLPYWTNGTGFELTGTHPLATVVSGSDLYRVKFGDPRYWEHWTVPASPSGNFTLVEDTSDPTHRYTFTSPMYPRTMKIGQVYTSAQLSGAQNVETSYSPSTSGTCTQQYQQQFPFSTELVTKLTGYTGFGGDLGPVTAIDLRYFYRNQTNTANEYEDNWNALGYGLVQWRLWHYDPVGNQVTDGLSTFNETTTTPMTQPDLSLSCSTTPAVKTSYRRK